jgi:hypothetical protein
MNRDQHYYKDLTVLQTQADLKMETVFFFAALMTPGTYIPTKVLHNKGAKNTTFPIFSSFIKVEDLFNLKKVSFSFDISAKKNKDIISRGLDFFGGRVMRMLRGGWGQFKYI